MLTGESVAQARKCSQVEKGVDKGYWACAMIRGMETTELIKAPEVAELLGYSEQHIYRLASTGKIPTVKLPTGGLRFDKSVVLAWARREEKSA